MWILYDVQCKFIKKNACEIIKMYKKVLKWYEEAR